MPDSHEWVAQYHSWANVAHDLTDLFTHYWFVTVHPTFAAGRFPLLKWAMLQPFVCIGKEFAAFRTECCVLSMFVVAVPSDHDLHGFFLTLHSGFYSHMFSPG